MVVKETGQQVAHSCGFSAGPNRTSIFDTGTACTSVFLILCPPSLLSFGIHQQVGPKTRQGVGRWGQGYGPTSSIEGIHEAYLLFRFNGVVPGL